MDGGLKESVVEVEGNKPVKTESSDEEERGTKEEETSAEQSPSEKTE